MKTSLSLYKLKLSKYFCIYIVVNIVIKENIRMKSVKGIIYALVSSGTFGLIPLFSIPLMTSGEIGLPSILFYRFLFSTVLMGAICAFRKHRFIISTRNILITFFLSLLYAATALCLIYSYLYIPSGVATTIHFLYPIFVSFLMVVFFRERKSLALLIAAVLSLVGVGFLCWHDSGHMSMVGILIVSLTIITYALYIVGINKSGVGKVNSEVLTFYILLAGCLLFFLFAVTTTGIDPIPSGSALWRLGLLALLPTVVSDLTLILAIKYAGSTVTSILGSMEPLVAVLVGVYFFGEHFDLYSFWGLFLVLLSVALVIISSNKAKQVK